MTTAFLHLLRFDIFISSIIRGAREKKKSFPWSPVLNIEITSPPVSTISEEFGAGKLNSPKPELALRIGLTGTNGNHSITLAYSIA
jgi:hypothetical protein